MTELNLGRLGFSDQGAYDPTRAYVARDVVTFGDDSTYRAIANTIPGENPDSAPTKWVLMARGTLGMFTTKGDMLVRDGVGARRLPVGLRGQVLTVGADLVPGWGGNAARPGTSVAKLASNSQDGTYQFAAIPCIMSDGMVKMWGIGTALGNGDCAGANQWTPSSLGFDPVNPPTLPIVQVVTISQTGYALDSAGRVFAWGNNAVGQLGQGDTVNRAVATRIQWFVDNNITIREIVVPRETYTVGNVTAWFVTTTGAIYAVGMGTSGQLGNGGAVNSSLPVRCGTISGVKSLVAAGGGDYGCAYAIDAADDLYVWGNNAYGQLGLGDTTNRNTPIKTSMGNVKKVVASTGNNSGSTVGGFAAVLTNGGGLWVTGLNPVGQLGLGNTTNQTAWTQVATSGWTPTDVAVGGGYVGNLAVISSAGNLYMCGDNAVGQLGKGDLVGSTGLIQIDAAKPFQGLAAKVKIGGSQSYNWVVIQDTTGRLWSAGYNIKGQCGVGTIVNQTTFAPVIGPAGTAVLGVADFQLGGYANFGRLWVRLNDGRLLACGENATGDIGTQSGNLHLDYILCDVLF